MHDDRQWAERAACRDTDTELFYPIAIETSDLWQVSAAKAVCAACSVQGECLEWAVREGEAHGVWGGTTPEERRVLRRMGIPSGHASVARHDAGADLRSGT